MSDLYFVPGDLIISQKGMHGYGVSLSSFYLVLSTKAHISSRNCSYSLMILDENDNKRGDIIMNQHLYDKNLFKKINE